MQTIMHFSVAIGMLIISQGQVFFIHQGIKTAIKMLTFINDRMSYRVLRGCWCDIIFIVHAPTEYKSDDTKESFYEELARASDKFSK
jgi:hypothetical protein